MRSRAAAAEQKRDFDTWTELETFVREHIADNDVVRGLGLGGVGNYSGFLFRGQASADWALETTLERVPGHSKSLSDYYRAVAIAQTQIESFTNRTWPVFEWQTIDKKLQEYEALKFGPPPAYDFLIYLRHHGFPSPLLDWSRSLYVAAFFAFRQPAAERVAIYLYQEYAGQGKVASSAESQIFALGPNVRTHQRHFLQQGEYTLCGHFDAGWKIAAHSSVFAQGIAGQDRLLRLTAPASESIKVLKQLDAYNINAFSLFQSEEALMDTVAARVLRR